MTAFLTDNLPLLTGAPNGIKRLRELILELAVRGKLVPQDPIDEPASKLLQRIAEEKARLVAGAWVKKQKTFAEISAEERPFTLPSGWEFVRLGDLVDPRRTITYGVLKPGGDTPDGVPLIKTENVQFNLILTEFKSRISAELDEEYKRTKLQGGEVLLTLVGSIGRCAIAPIELAKANLSRSVGMIVPVCGVDKLFMVYAITALINESFVLHNCAGTAQKVLNVGTVNDMPYPLPPLAEQHRIVAKVDELMVLCDRLEAQQADAESAHAQLVQALLHSLTQASDANDFATNWQRLAEHFHTLFTTESSIDALKQTLLQLAVMGKLVPQDPSDEPACELLKRIAEEKARLVVEGKIKKQKSLPDVGEEEKPYALPSAWKWVRFDSVSNTRLGKMLDKAKNKGELRPYLRNTNVQWFNFEVGDLKKMRFEEHEFDEYRVVPGDLVICEGGEPGRCAVWQGELEDMFIQKALHRARPWLGISPFFLQFSLKAAAHSGSLNQFFTGATIKHFSGEKLAKYPVPLPPLTEQLRIVAKTDELMALCDQLKIRLNQSRQINEQLASTLVKQATN